MYRNVTKCTLTMSLLLSLEYGSGYLSPQLSPMLNQYRIADHYQDWNSKQWTLNTYFQCKRLMVVFWQVFNNVSPTFDFVFYIWFSLVFCQKGNRGLQINLFPSVLFYWFIHLWFSQKKAIFQYFFIFQMCSNYVACQKDGMDECKIS